MGDRAPLLGSFGEMPEESMLQEGFKCSWQRWFHCVAHNHRVIIAVMALPGGRFLSQDLEGTLCFWRCVPGAPALLEGTVELDVTRNLCVHPLDSNHVVSCGLFEEALCIIRLEPGAAPVLDHVVESTGQLGECVWCLPWVDGRFITFHGKIVDGEGAEGETPLEVRAWHWTPGRTLEPACPLTTTPLPAYTMVSRESGPCVLSDGRLLCQMRRQDEKGRHRRWLQVWRAQDGGPLEEDARTQDLRDSSLMGMCALPDGCFATAENPALLQIWHAGAQLERTMTFQNFFDGQDVNDVCWIEGVGLLGCGDKGLLRLVALDFSVLETARSLSASVDELECQDRLADAMDNGGLQDRQLGALMDWAQLEMKPGEEFQTTEYVQRLTRTYDTVASMVCNGSSQDRTRTFMRALQDHVFRLSREEDFFERRFTANLDEEAAQVFAATPIIRSLIVAKYNEGPRLWFMFQSIVYACLMAIFVVVVLQQIHNEEALRAHPANIDMSLPEHDISIRNGHFETSLSNVVALALLSIASGLEILQMQALASAELARVPRFGGEEQNFWVYARKRLRHAPLAHIGLSREWRTDPSNWIDVALLVNFFANFTRSYRAQCAYEEHVVVIGIIMMLLKILEQLRGMTYDFATFVPMLYKIFYAIKEFIIVMAVFLFSFGLIFHVRLGHRRLEGASSPWATPGSIVHTLFMMTFTGNFDEDAFPEVEDQIFLKIFIVVMIVVMLNVLIALVSDAYDEARTSAEQLYWKAQQHLVAQISMTYGRFALCPCRRRTVDQKFKTVGDALDEQVLGGRAAAREGRVLDIVWRVQRAVQVELARNDRRRRVKGSSAR